MIRFNYRFLADHPGLIIHVRGNRFFWSKAIQKTLGSWGNHDALVLSLPSGVGIGDTEPMRSKVTSLADYEKLMNAGGKSRIEVKVYIPEGYTAVLGNNASWYWQQNVKGTMYDFRAYPRLFIKGISKGFFEQVPGIGALARKPAGWEWANWCTEGVCKAWKHAGQIDIAGKENPTPLTMEKRVGTTLRDITSMAIVRT